MLIRFSRADKHELTADEKKTQEYDKLAFKLVGYAAAPLMAGYTYYSRTLLSVLSVSVTDHCTSSYVQSTTSE